MSKNVSLWGNTYTDCPGVNLPVSGGGTAYFADTADADATAGDIAYGKTAYVNGVKITGTAVSASVTQDANGYIVLPSDGGGGGGGGGATQHTIHLEFSDSTDTDVDVYYDDSIIGTMITAYNPNTWTYSSKTVTLAQLDNVTWYDKQSIPIGVQLVDYTKVVSGYVVDDSTGEEVVSQWSCCSDFIFVDPSMTFSYVAYRWYNIVFYNNSKAYLGSLYLDNDYTSLDGDYAHGSLTPAKFPSGTAYVRLSSYPNTGMSASTMSLIRTA